MNSPQSGMAPLPPAPLGGLPAPRIRQRGGVLFLAFDARDRLAVATTIERLINFLDAFDADPDAEDGGYAEPVLGWREDAGKGCPPDWVYAASAERGVPMQDDDREDEDEHGGDVQDEPHDEEPLEEDALHYSCDWTDDPDTPQDGREWWGLSCIGAQAGAASEARL